MLIAIFLLLAVVFLILWLYEKKKSSDLQSSFSNSTEIAEKNAKDLKARLSQCESENNYLSSSLNSEKAKVSELQASLEDEKKHVSALSEYQDILDAKAEAASILQTAKDDAKQIREKADQRANQAISSANSRLSAADLEASRIVSEAEARAKEIAGEAYEIAGKAKEYERTATAMRNIIDGYGDRYLKPTYSLLDELAEDFGYTEAGEALKQARENTARMVSNGTAANCDYVEDYRKRTAIVFVIDAFNGKVDSILSKTKKDNYGTLEQKIKDAYQIVNNNGRAFRNASITPEYLSARLEELKWGVRVSELKAKAQEEQRQIREQMREEEKARREYEKARKEAEKEEEMLRKAMEKAQKQLETANEAKRAEYESRLADLQAKLQEAEERNQRAISMAQQTRRGNVYVISNIGSFGENVYKVGMTRRLDPMDRVRELGDASVPFPFDVHAIIESDDAPALETDLHKALAVQQMNKVNPRKEFFKVSLAEIKSLVDAKGFNTTWTMAAEAAEYRETLAIEASLNSDPDAMHRWELQNAASVLSDDEE